MTEIKKYRITTSSRIHFLLTIFILPIVCLIPTMFLVGKLEDTNKDLFGIMTFIVVGLYFLGGWFLSKRTSKAKLIVQIVENGLDIKWERNYILYKYSDRFINWQDINWYKFTPDQHFDIFKIKVKRQRNFKFEHASNDKDDFRSFNAAFRRNIRERNENVSDNLMILEAPNMYDGLTGKILMGFGYFTIAAGIILIPWAIISGQKINPVTIFGLLGAMGSGAFTIGHVKNKQKKNKNKSA
ncbi:MAG: hypothetical protein IH597_13670 [Bacteroidales bacterium]|nr:hypothetical protein [Bacteroidales bacterium]